MPQTACACTSRWSPRGPWQAHACLLKMACFLSWNMTWTWILISWFSLIFLNGASSFPVFIYLLRFLSLMCFVISQDKPRIRRTCRPECHSTQYVSSLEFHIPVFHMSLTSYVHLNPLYLIINCQLIANYIHRHLLNLITQQEPSTWINYLWCKCISLRSLWKCGSKWYLSANSARSCMRIFLP